MEGKPDGSPELGEDLLFLGEAAELLLGEDQLAVHADLEDAAARLDEVGLDAVLLLDLGRQTGGARLVVSNAAVLDANLRARGSLPVRHRGPPCQAAANRRLF